MAEDSLPFRKRRQVGSATQTTTTVTLEFGEPPEVNISQPTAPSVAEEIQISGEVNDSVDIEVIPIYSCSSIVLILHTYVHTCGNMCLCVQYPTVSILMK